MKRKGFILFVFALFLAICLSTSCKTRQKLVYFNSNTKTDTSQIIQASTFDFKFKTDDIVSIQVSGTDPELLKPFMMNSSQGNNQDGYETGNASKDGYLIDQNGEINFPVIGKIKIGGLSRIQAIDLMTLKLKEYVNDPIVNLRVTNFKITVLGSVQHPGTFMIPNERITILEALGLCEDTKITGVRKNVLIVRETQNVKQEIRLDLTSKDIFSSPAYYLQQNDVVYVEPNNLERFSSTILKSSTGVVVSSVTVVLTALNIILNK